MYIAEKAKITIHSEQANILLLEHHSISYIAEVLGFASASHFSKAFKQNHGIPTVRFRSNDILY